MFGIKVMKSPCSWRCTQMDNGECWDPKVWSTGGALHLLWSRFRASVYWEKERSCILSISLTTDSLFSSSFVTVLCQEWAVCPSHCCVPTWHLRHVGLQGWEHSAGQETSTGAAHAESTCSCWHPAFDLKTLKVFSPNLLLPSWSAVWSWTWLPKGGHQFFPSPASPRRVVQLDLKHQLTTCKLVY